MNMAGSEMPVKTESMGTPAHGMWTTPTSSGMRPRPATIHEGFSYCIGENYNGLPAWDSSNLPLQPQQQQHTPSDTVSSRPISMHQEYYPPTTMDNGMCASIADQTFDSQADTGHRPMDAKAHGGQSRDARH